MKRRTKGLLAALCSAGVLFASGCGNKDMGWGNYDYHYVTCNGVIELDNEPISSWKDSEGEQLEITLKKDGNNILVSANYCVLSKEVIEMIDEVELEQ